MSSSIKSVSTSSPSITKETLNINDEEDFATQTSKIDEIDYADLNIQPHSTSKKSQPESATQNRAQQTLTRHDKQPVEKLSHQTTFRKMRKAFQIWVDDQIPSKREKIVRAQMPDLPRHKTVSGDGFQALHLGKMYKRRPVLRDVSLNVNRGEVVGLLGPNGAGKTTCFYIMTGLIAPDYGAISFDGRDITDFPMYRRARMGVGYLPQEASIFRGLSVEDNIRAVLQSVTDDRDKQETQLEELLGEFSITHLRRSPSVALSGGERRRVEIARALASQPHFILLDEPLAGIDPIAVSDIRDLVIHLKDRNIGVLITDHNVRETLDIVDRAYILHDGAVLMEGIPDEIIRHDGVRQVYLGDKFSL